MRRLLAIVAVVAAAAAGVAGYALSETWGEERAADRGELGLRLDLSALEMELTERLEELERSIRDGDLGDRVQATSDAVERLRTRIRELEQPGGDGLSGRIDELEQRVDELEGEGN